MRGRTRRHRFRRRTALPSRLRPPRARPPTGRRRRRQNARTGTHAATGGGGGGFACAVGDHCFCTSEANPVDKANPAMPLQFCILLLGSA
jgi:hypothetical protein